MTKKDLKKRYEYEKSMRDRGLKPSYFVDDILGAYKEERRKQNEDSQLGAPSISAYSVEYYLDIIDEERFILMHCSPNLGSIFDYIDKWVYAEDVEKKIGYRKNRTLPRENWSEILKEYVYQAQSKRARTWNKPEHYKIPYLNNYEDEQNLKSMEQEILDRGEHEDYTIFPKL